MQNLSPVEQQEIATAMKINPTPDSSSNTNHTLMAGPPRLSTFSGESGKGDVSFDQWKLEVKGLIKDQLNLPSVIVQSVRRSLRGTAADVLRTLGEDITAETVIEILTRIFGNILPPETLLEQFYSAKQGESEKVAGWACRLDDLVAKLQDRQDKDKPLVSADVAQTMVRTKFFSGLRPGTVKNAIWHLFDNGTAYDSLLVSARVAELEDEPVSKPSAQVSQATVLSDGMAKKMDQLLASLGKMEKRLGALESNNSRAADSRKSAQSRPFRVVVVVNHCFTSLFGTKGLLSDIIIR